VTNTSAYNTVVLFTTLKRFTIQLLVVTEVLKEGGVVVKIRKQKEADKWNKKVGLELRTKKGKRHLLK